MLLHGEVLVEEVVLPDEATHLSTFVTPRLTLPQRGVAHLLPVDLERAREARVPSAENGKQRCLPSPTSSHSSQPQPPRAEDRRHLATRGVPVDVLQNHLHIWSRRRSFGGSRRAVALDDALLLLYLSLSKRATCTSWNRRSYLVLPIQLSAMDFFFFGVQMTSEKLKWQ